MNYFFFVVGGISKWRFLSRFLHHFLDQDVRPQKKTQPPTADETETYDSDGGGGGNGKTVPSNSADSWVRSKGYKLCEKCAEKSEINVGMIIIVLDSAAKRVVCVDALIMYRSKKDRRENNTLRH